MDLNSRGFLNKTSNKLYSRWSSCIRPWFVYKWALPWRNKCIPAAFVFSIHERFDKVGDTSVELNLWLPKCVKSISFFITNNCSNLLAWQELDEKIDTAHISRVSYSQVYRKHHPKNHIRDKQHTEGPHAMLSELLLEFSYILYIVHRCKSGINLLVWLLTRRDIYFLQKSQTVPLRINGFFFFFFTVFCSYALTAFIPQGRGILSAFPPRTPMVRLAGYNENYLILMPERIGFGPVFIHWIRLPHTAPTAAELTNNNSEPLNLPCEGCQGCTMSPLLFQCGYKAFSIHQPFHGEMEAHSLLLSISLSLDSLRSYTTLSSQNHLVLLLYAILFQKDWWYNVIYLMRVARKIRLPLCLLLNQHRKRFSSDLYRKKPGTPTWLSPFFISVYARQFHNQLKLVIYSHICQTNLAKTGPQVSAFCGKCKGANGNAPV